MKILSTYNIKGGVGKTATAVNLSYVSASEGFRTLVWDLDPQGAASYYFRVKPKIKGGGEGLVHKFRQAGDLIKATDFASLDLLPADFSYRNMDLLFDDFNKPTRRLAKVLRPLREQYDIVFIDAPPGISLVSENVFYAADALLVPTIPTTLSMRTLEQIARFIGRHELHHLMLLPFFSMVDRRKSLHRSIVEVLANQFPGFLSTEIPNSADIERMGQYRKPVLSYSSSAPARAYLTLWQEIKGRLGVAVKEKAAASNRAGEAYRFKAKELRRVLDRLQSEL